MINAQGVIWISVYFSAVGFNQLDILHIDIYHVMKDTYVYVQHDAYDDDCDDNYHYKYHQYHPHCHYHLHRYFSRRRVIIFHQSIFDIPFMEYTTLMRRR